MEFLLLLQSLGKDTRWLKTSRRKYTVEPNRQLYADRDHIALGFHLYESLLLIVSCPESSCSSPATLKHTFFPFRSPFSASLSADM